MEVEILLFLSFLCEAIIVVLLGKIIDKFSELNFNITYYCPKLNNNDSFKEETMILLREYEETISGLEKKNKQLKKGNKKLQKNNVKLQNELDCLKKQYEELSLLLSDKSEKSDEEEWKISGVIYE